ncbi:unnamed protein product [Cochlearia groenlandica]
MDRSVLPSNAKGKGLLVVAVNNNDRISKLPDDLSIKILSILCTREVVSTSILSKRWVDVWKETDHLFVDMREMAKTKTPLSHATSFAARSVTKNSNTTWEEVESSVGKREKKPWEKTKPFPKVNVRAYNVWLFNFSGSKEEFALASHLITQRIVTTNMLIIKQSSVSLNDKLEIEEKSQEA